MTLALICTSRLGARSVKTLTALVAYALTCVRRNNRSVAALYEIKDNIVEVEAGALYTAKVNRVLACIELYLVKVVNLEVVPTAIPVGEGIECICKCNVLAVNLNDKICAIPTGNECDTDLCLCSLCYIELIGNVVVATAPVTDYLTAGSCCLIKYEYVVNVGRSTVGIYCLNLNSVTVSDGGNLGLYYSVTLALVCTYRLGARSVKTLTALRTYILTAVRRNNGSILYEIEYDIVEVEVVAVISLDVNRVLACVELNLVKVVNLEVIPAYPVKSIKGISEGNLNTVNLNDKVCSAPTGNECDTDLCLSSLCYCELVSNVCITVTPVTDTPALGCAISVKDEALVKVCGSTVRSYGFHFDLRAVLNYGKSLYEIEYKVVEVEVTALVSLEVNGVFTLKKLYFIEIVNLEVVPAYPVKSIKGISEGNLNTVNLNHKVGAAPTGNECDTDLCLGSLFYIKFISNVGVTVLPVTDTPALRCAISVKDEALLGITGSTVRCNCLHLKLVAILDGGNYGSNYVSLALVCTYRLSTLCVKTLAALGTYALTCVRRNNGSILYEIEDDVVEVEVRALICLEIYTVLACIELNLVKVVNLEAVPLTVEGVKAALEGNVHTVNLNDKVCAAPTGNECDTDLCLGSLCYVKLIGNVVVATTPVTDYLTAGCCFLVEYKYVVRIGGSTVGIYRLNLDSVTVSDERKMSLALFSTLGLCTSRIGALAALSTYVLTYVNEVEDDIVEVETRAVICFKIYGVLACIELNLVKVVNLEVVPAACPVGEGIEGVSEVNSLTVNLYPEVGAAPTGNECDTNLCLGSLCYVELVCNVSVAVTPVADYCAAGCSLLIEDECRIAVGGSTVGIYRLDLDSVAVSDSRKSNDLFGEIEDEVVEVEVTALVSLEVNGVFTLIKNYLLKIVNLEVVPTVRPVGEGVEGVNEGYGLTVNLNDKVCAAPTGNKCDTDLCLSCLLYIKLIGNVVVTAAPVTDYCAAGCCSLIEYEYIVRIGRSTVGIYCLNLELVAVLDSRNRCDLFGEIEYEVVEVEVRTLVSLNINRVLTCVKYYLVKVVNLEIIPAARPVGEGIECICKCNIFTINANSKACAAPTGNESDTNFCLGSLLYGELVCNVCITVFPVSDTPALRSAISVKDEALFGVSGSTVGSYSLHFKL